MDAFRKGKLMNEQNAVLLRQIEQSWESIGICNDFIFCKIMQDEELLAELIKRILPDLKFCRLDIQAQKSVEIGPDIHGVRFDVFAELDDGSTAEIEMQVMNTGNLPKRIRFYGSMADTQMLEKGILYTNLKDSYVIMICPFDEYCKGRHIYTFTNKCSEEPHMEMGDGTTKIVLNAAGTLDDVSDKLKAFLDYIAGKSVDDEYVKKLDEAVQRARANKKWRKEYMTLMMRDLENRELGRKEGREEGRDVVNSLVAILINEGRLEDLERSSKDPDYQNELIRTLLPDMWEKLKRQNADN